MLCTPISKCSTERSFLDMKREKSFLRSCSKHYRLNRMAVIYTAADVTTKFD